MTSEINDKTNLPGYKNNKSRPYKLSNIARKIMGILSDLSVFFNVVLSMRQSQ